MDEPIAFLDGQFLPASRLALSVTDAGFVLGAAVAEQLRCFGGRLYRIDDHLDRLEHSLDIVGFRTDLLRTRLTEIASELVERNHPLLPSGSDLGLAIFVTPGEYGAYRPAASGPPSPTVCLHTYPLPFHAWVDKYRQGQTLVTTPIEQVPSTAWPASLKCRSRMHYYLADRQAAAIDPTARALLLDGDGWVTEASTANLMIYRADEGLISPPEEKVLPGISLAEVTQLAARLGTATVHRDFRPSEVASADEVLLTSTPLCLLPVTRFNGQPIGDGTPGDLFRKLMLAWNDEVGIDIVAQAEQFA